MILIMASPSLPPFPPLPPLPFPAVPVLPPQWLSPAPLNENKHEPPGPDWPPVPIAPAAPGAPEPSWAMYIEANAFGFDMVAVGLAQLSHTHFFIMPLFISSGLFFRYSW